MSKTLQDVLNTLEGIGFNVEVDQLDKNIINLQLTDKRKNQGEVMGYVIKLPKEYDRNTYKKELTSKCEAIGYEYDEIPDYLSKKIDSADFVDDSGFKRNAKLYDLVK